MRRSRLSQVERERLAEAGVGDALVHAALRAFSLAVLERHALGAPVLCAKDPFMMATARLALAALPHSRFIFVVRDGRAVVHSVITSE